MDHRTCKTCHIPQPESEFYHRSDGLLSLHCKACTRAAVRESGAKARRTEGMAVRRLRVVTVIDGIEGQVCHTCGVWKPLTAYHVVTERVLAHCKECYRPVLREQSVRTYPARKASGQAGAARRAAYWRNPDWYRARAKHRRAMTQGAPISDLTSAEWTAILAAYEGCCAYCDAPGTTQDHVLPLSRGGNHTAANIVPACRSCNSRKRTRTPEEWGREIRPPKRPVSLTPPPVQH